MILSCIDQIYGHIKRIKCKRKQKSDYRRKYSLQDREDGKENSDKQFFLTIYQFSSSLKAIVSNYYFKLMIMFLKYNIIYIYIYRTIKASSGEIQTYMSNVYAYVYHTMMP